ncbi:hypothetical protein KAR91_55310 [Candidatus Pacearchaeota archaeon]|nr:hypothetical protein [Candidatus Pacearchaeota archaeon]
MNRRSFLKKLPFAFVGGVAGIASAKEGKLPVGYISPEAKKIMKEIDASYPTKELSKQLLDELLDNSNPTEKQFEEMFDKCVVSADTLFRLSAHGFRRK